MSPGPEAPPALQKDGIGHSGAALAALVPGALAGTQVAGLLFFLNPHLPFDPIPVLSCVGFYASLLGGMSLLLTLPFTRGRRDRTVGHVRGRLPPPAHDGNVSTLLDRVENKVVVPAG